MAVFGFLIGSILGLVSAIAGLVFGDISMLSAVAIYLGGGFAIGTVLTLACTLRQSIAGRTSPQAYA